MLTADEIENHRRTVRMALLDLRESVKSDFGWPTIHPANQRKFDRDMDSVVEAERALDALCCAVEAKVVT